MTKFSNLFGLQLLFQKIFHDESDIVASRMDAARAVVTPPVEVETRIRLEFLTFQPQVSSNREVVDALNSLSKNGCCIKLKIKDVTDESGSDSGEQQTESTQDAQNQVKNDSIMFMIMEKNAYLFDCFYFYQKDWAFIDCFANLEFINSTIRLLLGMELLIQKFF